MTGYAAISRRGLMGGALAGAVWAKSGDAPFVCVDGRRFVLNGRTYRFAGANMWYGAYLGAGNRERLMRELDRLAGLGITNLRVLGASELSPLKNSLRPAIRGPRTPYDETLLRGLDYLLAEMGKRDLKAVIYLNNFWEWSGGMVTYLYWVNGGRYFDLNDPAHPWPAFANLSAGFYANCAANALYRDYVRALIGRRNTITGTVYFNDPAIMTWQLANEPRPGGSTDRTRLSNFYAWLDSTAAFIKSLDPNHLVSTGNEGLKGCLDDIACVEKVSVIPGVDYMTFHIWPLNWSWLDAADMASTYPRTEANTREYITTHLAIAERAGRPLVAEEFGLPRDGGLYAPAVPTSFRDRYYKLVFDAVEESAARGGSFAGTNFWSWGGEGRAMHADFMMRSGEAAYTGDPPQEPQGRNSVFDSDVSTLDVIRAHAHRLAALPG